MILRKYMALLGIGSTQIDLILDKVTYKLGEHVTGFFMVKGGTIEQKLRRIDCDFVRVDEGGSNAREQVIDSITIFTTKSIESGVISKIPFTFVLPISIGTNCEYAYHFKSKLTFNQGVESLDYDDISIEKNNAI